MRVYLLAALLAAVAAAQDPRPNPDTALGAQATAQLRRQSTPLDSAAVRAWVERIRERLAAQLPVPGQPFNVEVIAGGGGWAGQPEPLVLPGGIFIRADHILKAQSEAELAGLLAHAMALVAQGHYTRVPSGQMPEPIALRNQGGFQMEADLLAVRALTGAGYDPAGLVRYLNRLRREPGTDSTFFSPPLRDVRIAALESSLRDLPAATYESPDPGEFARVQAEVLRAAPARRPQLRHTDSAPTLKKPA